MVIQRIQSLFLLIAVVLLVIFMFTPFGFWNVTDGLADMGLAPLVAVSQQGVMVPVCVAALLSLIAIFLFKKQSVQKLVVALAIVATLASAGMVIYLLTCSYADTNPQVVLHPQWGGGGLLLVGTLITLVAAYRFISADQRLLRSYDRLR